MSSETSTDHRQLPDQTPAAAPHDAGLQVWQLFTLAGLITASVVAFYATSRPPSVRVALILTTFGAAAMGVAAMRTFAPLTGKSGPLAPPVIGGRTRAALERDKALVLRSIKELEFDRAMGKVSDRDFTEMSARLRGRAARILRQLDAGSGYREAIDREVARRLASEPPAASEAKQPGSPKPVVASQRVDDDDSGAGVQGASATSACAACGTSNDADARFCKECGERMYRAS
jgi:hypothetical protein